jgi:excisionase family DNA binding protein
MIAGTQKFRFKGKVNFMENIIAMDIQTAVKLSGISRTILYEALKRGDLKAKKLGKRTLILRADLENYILSLEEY